MKRIVLALVLVVVFGAFAFADVLNTKHDLSVGSTGITDDSNTTQICVFCHTPHGSINTFRPLWNHNANQGAGTTFTIYGHAGDANRSTTMNSTPTNFAANANNSSAFCLGCHDGVSAVNTLANKPSDVGAGNVTLGATTEFDADGSLRTGRPSIMGGGGNLLNEHPINMTPPLPAVDPGMAATVGSTIGGLPLYTGNTVQCGSCHNPHDNTNAPFLRLSMADSALCSACHTNK